MRFWLGKAGSGPTKLSTVPWRATIGALVRQTCGGVVSTTVTVKLHVFVLPWVSSTMQWTSDEPGRKLAPEGGTQTRCVAQLSVAVTMKATGVPAELVHSTVRLPGQVMTGASVSTTV